MLKLVEAQQEKAVLEKLRDNQLSEWEAEQRRREQRMMDELASRAHYQLS
jgi:flagellar export protein FliJ